MIPQEPRHQKGTTTWWIHIKIPTLLYRSCKPYMRRLQVKSNNEHISHIVRQLMSEFDTATIAGPYVDKLCSRDRGSQERIPNCSPEWFKSCGHENRKALVLEFRTYTLTLSHSSRDGFQGKNLVSCWCCHSVCRICHERISMWISRIENG